VASKYEAVMDGLVERGGPGAAVAVRQGDQAPYLDKARSLAINLLQKAGYDVDQIVGLLDVPESYVRSMTNEAFVNPNR